MPSIQKSLMYGMAGVSGGAVVAWRTLFPWISDDITTLRGIRKFIRNAKQDLESEKYLIDTFEEHVSRHPKKTFIFYEMKAYSYEYVNQMANKVANVVLTWDIKPGDAVAVMMYNEPAFIWTLLGLCKIGMVDAFINYHLTSEPLLHSIKASGARALIVGSGDDLLESLGAIKENLPSIPIYVTGKCADGLPDDFTSMSDLLERALPVPVCRHLRSHVTLSSPICYISTSGTTGLPKPAVITHAKSIASSKVWTTFDFNGNDVCYVVTPLYHSGATTLGLFNTLAAGGSIVIRRKFSARHYFEDCRRYNVTVFHYIGELCRYILKVPKSPLDGVHNIRAAMGNGLRTDIWKEFQDRFKIPLIVEHFGATEGPSIFVNLTGKVGAVGRLSPLMKFASKYGYSTQMRIVKYDRIKDEPVRDKNGRCIEAKAGEEGLAIAAVPETTKTFYVASREVNEKKFVRNAFVDGDAYFSFGDTVYLDKDYYVYFRDRIGDTFRWKGENVSTREVCDVLSTLNFIQDVNVYGVEVPDNDGRAGMAAVTLKENVHVSPKLLQDIYEKCEKVLPAYARPIFLRFQHEFTVTQTMKHRKVELVDEGFNPRSISDPLYYMDIPNKTYSRLTPNSYDAVIKSRL